MSVDDADIRVRWVIRPSAPHWECLNLLPRLTSEREAFSVSTLVPNISPPMVLILVDLGRNNLDYYLPVCSTCFPYFPRTRR